MGPEVGGQAASSDGLDGVDLCGEDEEEGGVES